MSRTFLAALTALLVLSLVQHLLTSVLTARLHDEAAPSAVGWTTTETDRASPHVPGDPGR